ncbi:HNH endonuclease [Cupriavidus sp. 2SB]|uniref:HNH endonuclease n=1 Tax=Cupriavidus sp. 2SB TaxID=2502199 RepID=UPI0010F70AE3|nr:HNH endonuclease [Cupriavidus sp. 2SB]
MQNPKLPRKILKFELEQIPWSETEFNTLLSIAAKHKDRAWDHAGKDSPLDEAEKELVKNFKTALKNHLYSVAQGRFCCFCGTKLQSHDATKDLEHLIAKEGKEHVVFALKNIALSCKDCNVSKGRKKVTVLALNEGSDDPDNVLALSKEYLIIHPHHDEWQEYLYVDTFGRVTARDASVDGKGSTTLRICGIHRKNAMELADHFVWLRSDGKRHSDWVDFYSLVNSKETDEKRLEKLMDFAFGLADALRSPETPSEDTIDFALMDIIERAGLSGAAAD